MIVANGCSLTAGDYEGTTDLTRSWPFKLGELLDTKVINLSLGGSSNKRILRTTMEYLVSNPSFDGTLIIAWTNFLRNEFNWKEIFTKPKKLNLEKNIFQANINYSEQSKNLQKFLDLYYKYSHNENYEQMYWAQQVLLLENYLKVRKIKYYFFFALDKLPNNLYTKQLDSTCWKTFNNMCSSDYLISQGFEQGNCSHFNHEANLHLAKQISKFLND